MSQDSVSSVPQRRCAECTRPFSVPAFALNKRFCSTNCRDAWHKRERRDAIELLRARRLAGAVVNTTDSGVEAIAIDGKIDGSFSTSLPDEPSE